MTDSVCFSFHSNAQCDKKDGSYNVIKQNKKNNYDADDYNGDDGATPVLAFNTWRCPDNATYSGPMLAASCPDSDNGFDMDGIIALDAGTYYVVIRSGGLNFNADGIVIDNVTMVKID